MKAHYIIISLFSLLLFACEKKENMVDIKGKFDNIKRAEFYIYCDGKNFAGIDTIKIEDGRFEYELEIKEKDILCLLYPNFHKTPFIAEPGTNIRIKGDASHLSQVEVGGTEENELLTDFRLKNNRRPENEKIMALAEFVRSHSGTMAAVSAWKDYFVSMERPGPEALQLLNVLLDAQPENKTLQKLNIETRALFGVNKDCQLPDFKVADVYGDSISKAQFAGKPLVIAFWANWQNESAKYVKELLNHKKKQEDKFNILHISLDATTRSAKRILSNDSTEILVCDSLMFNTPLALRFGVRFVPSSILVDETGKVIDRDLPLKQLIENLEKL